MFKHTLGCKADLKVSIVTSNQVLFISLQVTLVCHGETYVSPCEDGTDPYEVPKKLGKFRLVNSGNSLTTEKLVQRIVERRLDYEKRNARKEEKEIAAYEALQKSKVQG